MQASPFPASVLRAPSPDAPCTCIHWLHCNCVCHDAHCDPAEAAWPGEPDDEDGDEDEEEDLDPDDDQEGPFASLDDD